VSLRIKGVIVPLLTPFDERGALDTAAVARLVDFLIARGVHGLFPGGTTGEGPLLSTDERRALAEAVVRAADGRVPVIIHTGAITTHEAVTLTRHAQECGADAAALITPFYFHYSDDALFRHFATVCEAAPDFPIYLYNNPGVTGHVIDADLVARLAEAYPNVTGMKDSGGKLENLLRCMSLQGGAFNTASGNDGDILAALALGIDACVSGNANFVPELVVALYEAASSGDLPRARELQAQVNAVRRLLEDGRDLSLFKGMLAARGIPVGTVRAPLVPAPDDVIRDKWQALEALGLWSE
jgi:4-hydroxy-tetrahydrodipicolinate synthase